MTITIKGRMITSWKGKTCMYRLTTKADGSGTCGSIIHAYKEDGTLKPEPIVSVHKHVSADVTRCHKIAVASAKRDFHEVED